jgi:hypothetical protein
MIIREERRREAGVESLLHEQGEIQLKGMRILGAEHFLVMNLQRRLNFATSYVVRVVLDPCLITVLRKGVKPLELKHSKMYPRVT